MNEQDRDVVRALAKEVGRIADALEAQNEQLGSHDSHFTPEQFERNAALVERQLAAAEEHNRFHMAQSLGGAGHG